MCYEPSARPPLPPIAGGSASIEGRRIELVADDGNRFAATAALAPRGGGGPSIVVMPDVRGLHPFYEELAVRFASAGVHAVAIDYFGRTAGLGPREEDFDFMAHVRKTTPDGVAADVAAAVAHLRTPEGGDAANVHTVGFCFGGRQSFNQAAARDHGLAGVIGFYGWPGGRGEQDPQAPINRVKSYA